MMNINYSYYEERIMRYLSNHYPELGEVPYHSPLLQKWIQELSELLQQENNYSNGAYFQDRTMIAGYLSFIFLQSFVKIHALLDELFNSYSFPAPEKGSINILDAGAGPGAAALAVYESLRNKFSYTQLYFDLVDIHSDILAVDSELISDEQHFQSVQWNPVQSDIEHFIMRTSKVYDIIILSLVLSELNTRMSTIALIRKLLSKLNNNGFLIILEPALQKSSHRLIDLRNKLLDYPISLIAPCLNRFQCPLTNIHDQWCYRELRWQSPESMQFLNRKMYREITSLKFSYLILSHPENIYSHKNNIPGSKSAHPVPFHMYRAMTFPSHEKGKWVLNGCGEDGIIRKIELLKKDLSEHNICFKEIIRGDLFNIADCELHGNIIRIKHM